MSKAYDDYLDNHIHNVALAYCWLRLNCFDAINACLGQWETPDDSCIRGYWSKAEKNVFSHDDSKYSIEEYQAYDEYFFPEEPVTSEKERRIREAHFQYAWQHHIHNNPHHWEHWIQFSKARPIDETRETVSGTRFEFEPLVMPVQYVIEMICDWMAFRMSDDGKSVNGYDLSKWYYANRNTILLHPNSEKLVRNIIDVIILKCGEGAE